MKWHLLSILALLAPTSMASAASAPAPRALFIEDIQCSGLNPGIAPIVIKTTDAASSEQKAQDLTGPLRCLALLNLFGFEPFHWVSTSELNLLESRIAATNLFAQVKVTVQNLPLAQHAAITVNVTEMTPRTVVSVMGGSQ